MTINYNCHYVVAKGRQFVPFLYAYDIVINFVSYWGY